MFEGNLRRRASRYLLGDEHGAAIIELALVAPILALTVIGIVDMSNAYSRKLALEQGAQRSIEKIMQTTQGETVDDTIKKEAVCQVNGTNSDGSCKSSPITAANVTVTYRLECTNADGTVEVKNAVDVDADCAMNQTQSQYVSVALTDKYTPMFPVHFASFNSDGSYHLAASAGMRTQ
jgi:Flp pilus assembly protein TadG